MGPQRLISSPVFAAVAALLAISIIVILKTNSLHTTHYFVKQTPIAAQLAWHSTEGQAEPDRLVIEVVYTSQGWRGSKLQAFLSKTGETLGLIRDVHRARIFHGSLLRTAFWAVNWSPPMGSFTY
jgi:hypothetical protein